MLHLMRLAIRSMRRNQRRSVLTLAAVTIGVAVVVFAYGFGEGILRMIIGSGVDGRVGAVQVHKKGFADAAEASPLSYDMPTDEMLAKVRAVPGVVAAAPRLRFAGSLSNGAVSSMVVVEAIDPVLEPAVCPERKNIPASRGGALTSEMAKAMNVAVGGTLTLTAPAPGGSMNALDLDVASLVAGAGFLEQKRIMTVTLPYAQELVSMEGRVTEIAVRVQDVVDAPAVASRLREALGPDYEVQTWDEVLPFLRDAQNRLRIVLQGVSLVLFLLVVFGVVNTMLMNVYERIQEIGTMLAVGARRSQVRMLFVLEAATLGLVGGSAGAVLGFVAASALAVNGLVITPPGAAFTYIVRPVPPVDIAILALVTAVLGASLAALYPANKAAALSPVEALRAP
jgi:putative ABC transport system permease protein